MRIAICAAGIFPQSIGGIQRHSRMLVETLAARHTALRLDVIHTHVGQQLFGGFPNVFEHTVPPRPERRNYLLETYELSGRMADVLRTMPDAVIYSQAMDVWKHIAEFTPRLIVNPHGLEPYQAITPRQKLIGIPYKLIHDHIFRHARFVVSLGGRLTTILRRHVPQPDRRIVVIPNGVACTPSADTARPDDDRRCRVLFVSRLVYNKGVPDLIEAFRILDARGLNDRFSLTLVGDGPVREQYAAASLPSNVQFVGGVDDARLDQLYRASDLFILPTLFEGMPTVVLEAMGRGLPVLVTDVGATTELVDESNGAIIPKRDPAGIASALQRFVALPKAVRGAMGQRSAAKVAERFTWDRVAQQHVDIFKQVSKECFS